MFKVTHDEESYVYGKGGNTFFYYVASGTFLAGDAKFDGGFWGNPSACRSCFSRSKNNRDGKSRVKFDRAGRTARANGSSCRYYA